jgi:hypothetical protein
MSKSPTEAELIALTDNLGFVELFQEFVEFLTMSKQKPATIYQDCSAVVTLITKGGGITRTKHLRARMNLGREAVEEKRASIVHVLAGKMDSASLTIQQNTNRLRRRFKEKQDDSDNGWALRISENWKEVKEKA